MSATERNHRNEGGRSLDNPLPRYVAELMLLLVLGNPLAQQICVQPVLERNTGNGNARSQARLYKFILGLRIETPTPALALKPCYQALLQFAVLWHGVHLFVEVDTSLPWHSSRRKCVGNERLPFIGRFTADLLFDLVERADPVQRLFGDGVGTHRMQVVDFPASVGQACSFLDATVEIQLDVTSERVGL